MKLNLMKSTLNQLADSIGARLQDVEVVIKVHNPGSIGGTPCVPVAGANIGIDWDANKLILHTDKPLTLLTDVECKAIEESVRKGQSWHAYQSYKKQYDKTRRIKNHNQKLVGAIKTCEEALIFINQTGLLTGEKQVNKSAIDKLEKAYKAISDLKNNNNGN